MGESNEEIINFYKKRIEPFIAIFILAFLITACVLLYQDNQLKKEISENCGWGDEGYLCYCQKNYVEGKKIEQANLNYNINLTENVTMDIRHN